MLDPHSREVKTQSVTASNRKVTLSTTADCRPFFSVRTGVPCGDDILTRSLNHQEVRCTAAPRFNMGKRIPTHHSLIAFGLLEAKRISFEDFRLLSSADSVDAMLNLTEKLYSSGQITFREQHDLVASVERETQLKAQAETKARLKEAEKFVGGGKGSPVAQGGLPSLGKRRP